MTEVFVFSFRSSKRFPGAFLSFSFFHTFFFFFLYGGKKKGRVALISQCSAFSLPLLYTVTILCVNFVKGHVLFCGTCSGHCGVPGFGDKCSVEKNKHDCQIFPAPY